MPAATWTLTYFFCLFHFRIVFCNCMKKHRGSEVLILVGRVRHSSHYDSPRDTELNQPFSLEASS